jgi:hypothetical protein
VDARSLRQIKLLMLLCLTRAAQMMDVITAR